MLSPFFLLLILQTSPTEGSIPLEKHNVYSRGPLAVSGTGTIALGDVDALRLLLFSRSGVKIAGGKGQGPGEFSEIRSIQWVTAANAFFVADWINNRLSRWNESGEFLGETTFFQYLGSIHFIDSNTGYAILDNSGIKGSTPKIVRFDLQAATTSIIWSMPPLKKAIGVHLQKPYLVEMKFLWDPQLIFAGGSDFLVINYTESGKIHLLDTKTSRTAKVFSVSLPLEPFSEEDLDRRFSGAAARFRPVIEQHIQKPESWPVISKVLVDDHNRIWLFGSRPPGKVKVAYQVLDQQGKTLANGQFPCIPSAIFEETGITLEQDDQDALFITKHTVSLTR